MLKKEGNVRRWWKIGVQYLRIIILLAVSLQEVCLIDLHNFLSHVAIGNVSVFAKPLISPFVIHSIKSIRYVNRSLSLPILLSICYQDCLENLITYLFDMLSDSPSSPSSLFLARNADCHFLILSISTIFGSIFLKTCFLLTHPFIVFSACFSLVSNFLFIREEIIQYSLSYKTIDIA